MAVFLLWAFELFSYLKLMLIVRKFLADRSRAGSIVPKHYPHRVYLFFYSCGQLTQTLLQLS